MMKVITLRSSRKSWSPQGDEDLKVPLDSEDIFSIFYYDVLCYHVCEDHFSHIDVDTIMEPENQWIYDQFSKRRHR